MSSARRYGIRVAPHNLLTSTATSPPPPPPQNTTDCPPTHPPTSMSRIPLPPLPMSQPQCEFSITQRSTDTFSGLASKSSSAKPLGSNPAAFAAW